MGNNASVFIVLPNNLFRDLSPVEAAQTIYLVEEFLYFRQYAFHKQKLTFHRASMKAYETYLRKNGSSVTYVDSPDEHSDIRLLIPFLRKAGYTTLHMYDPCDEWLQKRIVNACKQDGMNYEFLLNPLFINSPAELAAFQEGRKNYFQSDFYIYQRKTRHILVDGALQPLQGRWSFDADNRRKYPPKKTPPALKRTQNGHWYADATDYVEQHFTSNPGVINPEHFHPVDHSEAESALNDFLEIRFPEFGIYEDAIVKEASYLHHSILSPLINTGLLLPMQVIRKAIEYAEKNQIPYNSLEGFVRQILGWREFVRMLYIREGNRQRTRNYWQFSRKIPESFYTGNTGIGPIDITIRKLHQSAYNHHIERLMVLSNFMLLCEFDPNEVYRWFMEMFIDAYDWVMVPNVYGMGQFADGGLMTTKPYISGSNYIVKMSDYKKGEDWTETWDALFWRFMHVHRSFFMQNPRLGMLLNTFDKWEPSRRRNVLEKAEAFLEQLDKQ